MTSSTRRFKRMIPALGTLIRLELEVSEIDFMKISSCVFDRIHELENKFSFFKPESEISRLNQAEIGVWVKLDPDVITVLKLAAQFEHDTKGAFSAGNSLVFSEDAVQKTRAEKIDLGGIAKGYCVDEAWREAEVAAQKLGLGKIYGAINAGGDLYLHERTLTQVLISGSKQSQIPHLLKVGAIATSSTEPREGMAAHYPKAKSALKSTASVEAPSAVIADALTKAVLFHPEPAEILKKWGAKIIYED